MTSTNSADLDALKAIVQSIEPATQLEHLTAALIGELIGVGVAVAKSGFQHGADAGTVGRQQRFLRVECKRYRDTTALDDRQLLGEIDHAVKADRALEVWILAATREVNEQLERQLFEKGESMGIPVLVLDWKSHEIPALAALLSTNPSLVSSLVDPSAGALAAKLEPQMTASIDRLRLDLSAWHIGSASVRRLSRTRLLTIWSDPRQSQAHFGQIVSGGGTRHIHRAPLLRALDDWWTSPPAPGSPACVTGLFGVGKTWAVADWLIERVDQLPATLLIPASAVLGHSLGTAYDVKTFLAQRLQDLMQVRDVAHWRARLERLLLRPEAEGPVLLLVLDGMNQQPLGQWESLLKVLQGAEFVGRVRVITTTRTHHFEVKLRRLAALVDNVVAVTVNEYEANPGGELDQMLQLHGLTRAELHPDLHTLARNPRLFGLVIRFRERFVDTGAVTLHRLLWEYGRDTAGASVDKVFSAEDWEDWLRTAAQTIRQGIRSYSVKDLSEMAARRDLPESEIYRRLSELVDSSFFHKRPDGMRELSPAMVAHALGATVVSLLSEDPDASRDVLESALAQWLDPISGLDQRDEILRAAVSIALEIGPPRPLLGVLAAAWLQTQNLADTHRAEIRALAAEMPEALLDVIELSHRFTHAASRYTAVEALRGVDRSNDEVRRLIFDRGADWLRRLPRHVDLRARSEPEAERHRQKRLVERIGTDETGPLTLLGESMVLVDSDDALWTDHLPALIEGYPLLELLPALRIASVAASVELNHRAWNQLRWVYLLNEVDREAVAASVRKSSEKMRQRVPEDGVHSQLNLRAAELLLHLSGRQDDDEAAVALNVSLGRWYSYENDYLNDPSHSIFALERRHAHDVLADESLPLHVRIRKCEHLWFDPTFEPPQTFSQAVAEAARNFPVEAMYTGRHATPEDLDFEKLRPVLARCAPQVLAELQRQLVRTVPTTSAARAARAWHQVDALLIHGPEEYVAARARRDAGRDGGDEADAFVASQLLLSEITELDALAQATLVVESDLPGVLTSITDDLLPMNTAQVDQLIERFRFGSPKQQKDVLVLLITRPPDLSPSAWQWVLEKTASPDEMDSRLAFMVLATADPRRLGTHLEQTGWCFSTTADTFAAHAASGALLEATLGQPFEQIASRLAPWRLLEAVRVRGEDASEARIAVEQLDAILTGGPREAPDLGAEVTVERAAASTHPPWYSVRPAPPEDPHSTEALRHALDEKAQRDAQARARETVQGRIEQVRKEGGSLFLEFVTYEDAQVILRHAPEVLDRWIAGHGTLSADFVRRVRLAEGLYLALCEALLLSDPARGVALWSALGHALRTRVLGAAGLPEWMHLIFRAPESPPVLAARHDFLNLEHAHTDTRLYELALVAQINGCGAWLESVIAQDLASDAPWQQQRASTMRGFLIDNSLPVAQAWPDGMATSWAQEVRRGAARLQYFEACAHHWWQEYWRREDRESAYAAWVLFCACADRRAMCWMDRVAARAPRDSALQVAKQRQWDVTRMRWKHGADASDLSLERRFLRRPIEEMVWPWRE